MSCFWAKAVHLYQQHYLKRVYYSAFTPVSAEDPILPSVRVPLMREHRLSDEADWLYRYYGFRLDELLSEESPNLDLEVDPKLAWALRHREFFPVDVNRAPQEVLLRVPGLGQRSVARILTARRYTPLSIDDLRRMKVPLSRTKYFLKTSDKNESLKFLELGQLRQVIFGGSQQLPLFPSTPSRNQR